MSKQRALLTFVLLLSLSLAACGGGRKEAPTPETPGASPPAGPINIDFWHSEQAANQETISRLVDCFNASQDEVKVRVSYQGTYDDAMAKLMASLPTGDVPAVAFLGDIYTQMIIDSGSATPMRDFVERDGYDLSDLDPSAIQSFTSDGKLWAMPFAMDVALLYYNKVALREVGLDPEKPPQDLEELRQYSEKLLKRDGSGNVTRSGLAIDIAAWTERMLAEHGDLWWTSLTGTTAAPPRSSSTTTRQAGSSSGGTTWWIAGWRSTWAGTLPWWRASWLSPLVGPP